MQSKANKQTRPRGTGSLFVYRGSYYGKFRVNGRQIKRKIGPKRRPGSRDGLTQSQAERRLQAMIDSTRSAPLLHERVTVEGAGKRLLQHLEAIGRKRSTRGDYESTLRVHLVPAFGDTPLEKISRERVEAFIATKMREGKAPKSIRNYLGLLHSIFAYAIKQGWVHANPVSLVDLPAVRRDRDLRYLDQGELEAVLRAVRDDELGPLDRALYLTAAMTGLRQGELLALRWRDIDWLAARVRVRQSYVRGEFDTPKSRRSSRSVPLAERLARELERYSHGSKFTADDDLVFGHPVTGEPLTKGRVLRRFKAVTKRAGLGPRRFHDLRHTFGTRMAAAGVPMRTLQEFMGHRDFNTTLIYADYAPSDREAELIERAFATAGTKPGTKASDTEDNSEPLNPHEPKGAALDGAI